MENIRTQRVCLALDLKNDPKLIEQYKHAHGAGHWPEISEGIRSAGILSMDIYLVDNRMFMICTIPEGESFDEIWVRIGTYPRQSEWEAWMSTFQQALPGHKLEWLKMEQVFELKK